MSATSATAPEVIDLAGVGRVLWEYKWLLTVLAIAFSLVGIVVATVTKPLYRAEIVVVENNEKGMGGLSSLANQFGGLASLAGVTLPSGGAGPEALALLKSQFLVNEFISSNDLIAVIQAEEEPERQTLWWASRTFRTDVLTVRKDTVNGTVSVRIEWKDAVLAAQWAKDFVALANQIMRTRAMEEATRSVEYLRKQIEQTNVVELRAAMYKLVENETKTLMLTNARPDYAFKIVDPPLPPERAIWPRRLLLVVLGAVVGLLIGSFVAFGHRARKSK